MALIRARALGVGRGEARRLGPVDLELGPGRGVAIVGPSGAGKSTLLRALVGLERALTGNLEYDGRDLVGRPRGAWAALRRHTQLVWQAADQTLDPRWRARRCMREAARRAGHAPADAEMEGVCRELGLEPELLDRRSDRLSGGQQQRLALARALLAAPAILLADEPTSALDPPLAAQVMHLLRARREAGLGVVVATHDLSLLPGLVDEVIVLDAGEVAERGPLARLVREPASPVTRALLRGLRHLGPA